MFKEVKDSGKRQEFKTGSVRDTDEGKGMPHLIAGEALAFILDTNVEETYKEKEFLFSIEHILLRYNTITEDNVSRNDVYELLKAGKILLQYMSSINNNERSAGLRMLSVHYANGSVKYKKNNWRLGQPISRYYDSAMRHIWAAIDGKVDECHISACLWNIIAIIQTKIDVARRRLPKELNDFPYTMEEVFNKTNTTNGDLK